MFHAVLAQILVRAFWGAAGPPKRIWSGETGVEIRQLVQADGLWPNATLPSRAGVWIALARYASAEGEPDKWLPALRKTLSAKRPAPAFSLRARDDLASLFPGKSPTAAERAFEAAFGESSGPLSGAGAAQLIHVYGMRWAMVHHVPYRAQAGDSFTDIALAAHLSLAQAKAANSLHGGVLWVGQRVRFRPAARAVPPPPASPPAGVIASVRPVAGLALLNPPAPVVRALSRTPAAYRAIALVTTGEWALWHPGLVRAWSRERGTWAVDGYSTTNLEALPAPAIRQELAWARTVIGEETGRRPAFVIPADAGAAAKISRAADGLNLQVLSAAGTVDAGGDWSEKVAAALARHDEGLVVAVSPAHLNWSFTAKALRFRHLVLETLSQIAYG